MATIHQYRNFLNSYDKACPQSKQDFLVHAPGMMDEIIAELEEKRNQTYEHASVAVQHIRSAIGGADGAMHQAFKDLPPEASDKVNAAILRAVLAALGGRL